MTPYKKKSCSLILVIGRQVFHLYFPIMLMIVFERLNGTYRRLKIGFVKAKSRPTF